MYCRAMIGQRVYRVWLVECVGARPNRWDREPDEAVAISPAVHECFSEEGAQAYLEGFNGQVLGRRGKLWAVAVPVRMVAEGDLRPGHQYRWPGVAEVSQILPR